jgi:hypothetical protein
MLYTVVVTSSNPLLYQNASSSVLRRFVYHLAHLYVQGPWNASNVLSLQAKEENSSALLDARPSRYPEDSSFLKEVSVIAC